MASSGVSISYYLRLVRGNLNFRRLWIAQIVSENGDWFYTLAIYNLLLDLTGKASSVALALVLQVLPLTLLGPLAGMVNDRFSRRKIMIATDLLRMVIVACMLLVRSRGSVWVIYPLLFLETVMVAFFEPARSAVIPNIVAESDVIAANTLSSATWSFDLAIGSVLGGIVAAWLGRGAVFMLNAFSFVVSALLIGRMQFVESHADEASRHPEDQRAGWSSIRAGFRYIARDPKLAAVVSLKAGVSILGASWVLLPVMGERIFPVAIDGISHSRAALFGMSLLMGARGVGALLGPLFASHWTGQRQSSLRMGGWYRISTAGKCPQCLVCLCCNCPRARRHFDGLGVFHHTSASEYPRPLPGKSLRRGPRNFHVRACGLNMDCRAGDRHRGSSASCGGRDRGSHVCASGTMGSRTASVAIGVTPQSQIYNLGATTQPTSVLPAVTTDVAPC
jgi:MFS family permease